jgi:hypothetical protein
LGLCKTFYKAKKYTSEPGKYVFDVELKSTY